MSSPRPHGARWRRVRAMAYDRDRKRDAPCHLCGQPIDYLAPPLSPDSWEPDHILPCDKHPDRMYDIANLAPSHSSCNRSRGDAEIEHGEPLGRPSRSW